MKITTYCILLQLSTLLAASQTTRSPLNSVQSGIGTYSQHFTDAFSFSSNQASLAYTSAMTAGVYGERRFLLEDLSWYQVAAILPTKSGHFGLKGTYFGNTANTEMEVGLAYGRKLGDKLAIGGQFNYYTQRIPQYKSTGAISMEAGLLLKINEQLLTGFHVYNPNGTPLGKTGERLPSIYTIGIGYEASDRFVLTTEAQKTEGESVNVKAALCYRFDKRLYAKAGISSVNALYSIAGGVELSAMRLEAMTSFHPQLGLTPGLMILFHKKEK